MPITYSSEAGTLYIPGAYAQNKVVATAGGIAANGYIIVLGESDGGPTYLDESDLSLNVFGPDQLADIRAKYISGPLVDACAGAINASNDEGILGSVAGLIPVKVNGGTIASGTIPLIGGGTYGTLSARLAGKSGNLINRTITTVIEVIPTTGTFVLASPQQVTDISFRVNGAAAVTGTGVLAQYATPTAMVSAINALSGVAATGGVDRTIIGSAISVNVTVSGRVATFTSTTTFAVMPTVGDILVVPNGTAYTTNNEGSYVVIGVTGSNIIRAYKVLDSVGTGASITNPSAEGPIPTLSTALIAYSPVTISLEAGAVVDGKGKSLEIANSGTYLLSDLAYKVTGVSTADKVDWVSTSTVPALLVSGTEYKVNLNLVRQKDSVSETYTIGGDVILTMGYTGTTASCVITGGVMTLTLVGGSSAGTYIISLNDYATVNDLCVYLGTIAGLTAAPGTNALGSRAPLTLDEGTYGFATNNGVKTGRIKADGTEFYNTVNTSSGLVSFAPVGSKTNGLPEFASVGFLAGGAKGATTNLAIQNALDACEMVTANFVLPCFSRNATADIAAGLTDSGSTYDIASINAAVKAHCLLMSQLKYRKRRLAVTSFKGSFTESKNMAGSVANSRCATTFQDVTSLDAFGSLKVFQPWMAAAKAVGMQSAGLYKDITNKRVNITGASAADFNDQRVSPKEQAIKAGLLTIIRKGTSFVWMEDQTTYTVDDNFVFNSLQAMYAADIVAATAEQRMESAFCGQSLADVSAQDAKLVLTTVLDELRTKYKLLSPSDDALSGYKNIKIRVLENVMVCSAEIKLTTSIKFIPIIFSITQIVQTA